MSIYMFNVMKCLLNKLVPVFIYLTANINQFLQQPLLISLFK